LIAVAGAALLAWRLPALARLCGADAGRATWLALAAPLMIVHVVSGAHNDSVMIGLVVCGLTLAGGPSPPHDRDPALWLRVLAVGAVFGLALAVKVTAVVVLPFAALLLVRSRLTGRFRSLGQVLAALAGTGVSAGLVLAAVSWLGGLGWGWINGLVSSGDSRQWTSLPTGVGFAFDYLFVPSGHTSVPVIRVIGIGVLAVVLAWLFVRTWSQAPRSDMRRIVAAAGWALAATVLLAPVFHPWYALWPLTILAAAGAGRRLIIGGNIGLTFLVLPDGFNLARVTKFPGALAMLALTGWLLWRSVRRSGVSVRR
ncbi:MAG: polyprenol phosphomannose-dependent alpha 1,6 mannosyltransferase MptB, partial [Longispora sp.]|nr:polyprenol phosphomannose-dependent alpha 1,6 mannosyltransferase MptB [Longispora sp. (in: high G+C Gram-positive bacteria)]